ncbi:hypothetical protein A3A70_03205 [candidate division WWE3 bacterium RIFCSPLOWO2_01_FULL_42_11]|uniref:Glycosyltransferase 2-like domain-containing protein n=1 Tax=candidate division WWE3 bacterium RIFCSPLOWO2_01_FULL_42_11 TaxID=1802627 RepID=A0A1F4VMI4_UNCKA|nr:MAG: hypothetical protein A3A70_03205 [candidate division WWE3 bacterium RIFCSPLOWO2_01_FULL_42_11]
MKKNKKITVSFVIPVYNEAAIVEDRIKQLYNELGSLIDEFEIILIENGSTDHTLQLCQSLSETPEVVALSIKSANYGLAMKTGILAARGKMIVNFDLDYFDVDFARQAMTLEPFGYDIIVASKNHRLSRDTRTSVRKLISSIYKYMLYYGFSLRISDTHGIKAWRNDPKLRELVSRTVSTYEIFDTELIIRSQFEGRKLLELPTQVTEIRTSVSHIIPRAFRGGWQILKLWFVLNGKERNKH